MAEGVQRPPEGQHPFAGGVAESIRDDASLGPGVSRSNHRPVEEESLPQPSARRPCLPVMVVVEEDDAAFMLLKRALYRVGTTGPVWWARTAEEALALVGELSHSAARICVVMEVRLSGSDAWELLARIKAHRDPAPIVCAILTGMSDRRTRERAVELGVDAFFLKPCQGGALEEIARALKMLALKK